MIRDSTIRQELSEDWAVVRKLCRSAPSYQISGGAYVNTTYPDEYYNLPLVLAYAVMEGCLNQMRDEGLFSCKDWKLGAKMEAARHLPWCDYKLIEAGRNARNDLAHRGLLVNKAECLRYVEAIEAELKTWSVL